MKYPPAVIDQIKQRVPLLDEVRRVVPKVQKKGKYWWACCPFHGEKSASFHIREEQGSYYCFGCGASGDVISFVQETQGGTFTEVVERLAQQAGVKLPEREAPNPARQAMYEQGHGALERAAVFYQRSLNADCRAYMEKRQLSPSAIEEFGLGYAPESYTATRDALLTEGFSPEVLRETGLALPSDKGKGDYDRFRGRLMFPIHDLKGRVVAFGGRVMAKDDKGPKYLNSPETPWFHKGALLYNLHRVKPHIKLAGAPVLVEGYMDVIALWQAGFKTAVAPMGTAVGADQLGLLWQLHAAPVVSLDGDAAGRNAAIRTALKALPILEPGKTLQFVFLPDGEDPDSLVRKDGIGAFRTLLASPVTLEAVLWQHISAGIDLKSADGRASADAKLGEVLLDIKHPMVKQAYRSALREKIYQATRGPRAGKKAEPGVVQAPTLVQAPLEFKGNPNADPLLDAMLAVVCRWPFVLENVAEALGSLPFPAGQPAELVRHLLRTYLNGQLEDDLPNQLQEGPFAGIIIQLLRDTGVALLPEDTDATARFREHHRLWLARQSQRDAMRQTMKDTNFFDPMAWEAFQQARLKRE